jgi:hypothetical protein
MAEAEFVGRYGDHVDAGEVRTSNLLANRVRWLPGPSINGSRGNVIAATALIAAPILTLVATPWLSQLTTLHLLILAFLVVAGFSFVMKPRGLVASRTWVVGYLLLQFPVRAVFLVSQPKEDPAVYSLYLPGSGLEQQLILALVQAGLGLLIFMAAYRMIIAKRIVGQRPSFDVHMDLPRAYILLVAGILLLPLEVRISSGETTAGGDFILSIPGLMASGAAAVVFYAFAREPHRYLLPFLLGSIYGIARVILLGSKLALLGSIVAVAIGLAVRSRNRRSGFSRSARGLFIVLVGALVAAYIFASAIPQGNKGGIVPSISRGAMAAVSRSYGVDSVIAVNSYLASGGNKLYGESFAEVVYSWVPRTLWPEKPKSFSVRFGEQIFSFSSLAGISFFAPTYSGEWLLNFDIVGLLVGWLVFGIFLACIDSLRSVPHRLLWLIAAVHLVEGSIVAQFWLAAPFIVGGYLALQPLKSADEEPT